MSGEGNGNLLQYSCLENPMDRGAWQAAVHEVTKSQTWLSDFTFFFHFHALEKVMATHYSALAWRIPGMAEPGGLPSMGSHRVRHDWSNLAASSFPNTICWKDFLSLLCIFWRQKWQPTPVFLPGESHGQRTLAGYSPWGCKSQTRLSDWTELN